MQNLIKSSVSARGTITLTLSFLAILSGCSSGDSATVNGDVSIAYVMRPTASLGNPTDAITFTPGGDLYLRDKSSPSAADTNITGSETNGQGDVSDPEVSYDGTKLLFSMRRPAITGRPADPGWRVWEYDITRKALRGPIACTVATGTTPAGDDVDPAYLPDGRIVFASNRQVKSWQVNGFAYLDEYERERVTALHVMNGDGSDCRQISFNQSHDRNPTVLKDGRIMYSRWDHVGGRNQFSIFTTKTDGTDLFVLYGAHSGVVSFLHPRELPNGQLLSDAMPLSRTHEGGAIMQIDVANFSENCEPASSAVSGCNGQHQPTANQINFGNGLSPNGRFSTPYPLWDGTNRALVSWAPSCAALGNCQMVSNPLTGVPEAEEGTPVYGVYMLDLNTGNQRPVVTAPPGYSVLDPVAVQSRVPPDIKREVASDNTALATKTSQIGTTGVGILNVLSVYDTDSLGRMGNAVLVSGIGESIPLVNGVADIARLKDPAQTVADQRPARFIRITRAVPTQSGISRELIGETDFEMQQIIGYAEVEPDGSFKIEVPADVPIAITAIDKHGRGFATHTNWIQVRPGETRNCLGCHSPRRGEPINAGLSADGYHPNTLIAGGRSTETMAATRTRLYPSVMQLKPDIEYQDVWSDTSLPGVTAGSPITIRYTGNTNPADDLTTAAPSNGVIDYPTHIHPLWTKPRTGGSCDSCHNNNDRATVSVGLDLRDGTNGMGRMRSYDELLIGDPILEGTPPRPRLVVRDDELVVDRAEAQVNPGLARGSHLIEVLFHQELKSDLNLGTTNHSSMLNAAEKRLVSEWIDLGAQFYNSPRDTSTTPPRLRGVTGLSEGSFHTTSTTDRDVHAILLDRCGSCHRAVGQTGTATTRNAGFVGRRFVLTGQTEGDFNVTLSMIGDVSSPATTELLRRPASTGADPEHGLIGGNAVMPAGDPDYLCIANWIQGRACP